VSRAAWAAANGVSPEARADVDAFFDAWEAFVASRPWESLADEVALPVRRTGSERVSAITVLGRAGVEQGLSFLEDLGAFDAVSSGAGGSLDGVSLFVDVEHGGAPLLVRVVDSQPCAPTLEDVKLADAALRVVLMWPQSLLTLHHAHEEEED